jgi:TRAP-type mannitol/chloroaromatic compound transport system substrate-binding protein
VSYYFFGKDPTFALGSAVPFGMNARQQSAWMLHGGGMELMREFYRDFNIIHFPAGNTGAQMGGWFRKEIKTVNDLKGLKMRVGGFAGTVLQRVGVVPQQLAGADVYPALEKGTIDAVEWVGPYDDEKLGLHKIIKNYYYPGWWEGGPEVDLYVNIAAYEKLPKEWQAILEAACHEATVDMLARHDTVNPPALRRLVASGVQLRSFSNEVMNACYKAANDVFAETCEKNPKFKKIFEPWEKFRNEQILWFSVAENRFDNFMTMATRPPAKK